MKKPVILLLLLCLLLAACGQAAEPEADLSPTAEPSPTAEAASPGPLPTEEPEPATLLPSLTLEQSQAMARLLNANRALYWGGKLYCYDFDENWEPALVRYDYSRGKLSGFTVLARGCVPEYLCTDGKHLYYIDRTSGAVERTLLQGGRRTVLREGPCAWLSLREGLLYFCDGEGRFLSLDPESGAETLILEGPCAFACPLEGGVLYQAADDGSRLFFRNTADGTDLSLSEGPGSTPLIFGDRLWYRSDAGLCSTDLDLQEEESYPLPETDGDVELLPEAAGLTIRGIRDEGLPAQWAGPPEGPFERQARGYRICDWLGRGVRVDTVYEPDSRIRCYLLTDDKGTEISFIAGRTT